MHPHWEEAFSLRCYLGSLFAGEHEATWRHLEDAKIFMKGLYPKRIDFLQPFRIDDSFFETVTSFRQDIEQFVCRSTVEIPNEPEIQADFASLDGHSEVQCHNNTPLVSLGCSAIHYKYCAGFLFVLLGPVVVDDAASKAI
jgi:hypothetical protein